MRGVTGLNPGLNETSIRSQMLVACLKYDKSSALSSVKATLINAGDPQLIIVNADPETTRPPNIGRFMGFPPRAVWAKSISTSTRISGRSS